MKEKLRKASSLTQEEVDAIDFQIFLDYYVASREKDGINEQKYCQARKQYYLEQGNIPELVEQHKIYLKKRDENDDINNWTHNLVYKISKNKTY